MEARNSISAFNISVRPLLYNLLTLQWTCEVQNLEANYISDARSLKKSKNMGPKVFQLAYQMEDQKCGHLKME